MCTSACVGVLYIITRGEINPHAHGKLQLYVYMNIPPCSEFRLVSQKRRPEISLIPYVSSTIINFYSRMRMYIARILIPSVQLTQSIRQLFTGKLFRQTREREEEDRKVALAFKTSGVHTYILRSSFPTSGRVRLKLTSTQICLHACIRGGIVYLLIRLPYATMFSLSLSFSP